MPRWGVANAILTEAYISFLAWASAADGHLGNIAGKRNTLSGDCAVDVALPGIHDLDHWFWRSLCARRMRDT